MARVEEADGRWIVQERGDGKNVNNWHWTEKSVLAFTRTKFEAHFSDMEIPCDHDLVISGVEQLKGDINVCNRKGKCMFIYDFECKMSWKGCLELDDGEKIRANGSIEVKDIDVDNEWRIIVSMKTKEDANTRRLKTAVRSSVSGIINNGITTLLAKVKEEKASMNQAPVTQPKQLTPDIPVRVEDHVVSSSTRKTTKPIRMQITYSAVSRERFFEIFTDQNALSAVTQSACVFEKTVGGKFSLLGGSLNGDILELSGEKIVLNWRFAQWNDFIESGKLTITFKAGKEQTVVTAIYRDVPSDEEARTRSGWESIWRNISRVFDWRIVKFVK